MSCPVISPVKDKGQRLLLVGHDLVVIDVLSIVIGDGLGLGICERDVLVEASNR